MTSSQGGAVEASTPGAGEAARARGVLWHERGSLPPAEVITSLDRTGLRWRPWDSDLLALAEVLKPEPATSLPSVLILVEPTRLAGLSDVLDAIERFRPQTPLWSFVSEGSPQWSEVQVEQLRRKLVEPKAPVSPAAAAAPNVVVLTPIGTIVPKSVVPKASKKSVKPAPDPKPASGVPRLRLAGEADTGPSPKADPEPSPAADTRSVLSGEELDMLLSDQEPRPGDKKNVR